MPWYNFLNTGVQEGAATVRALNPISQIGSLMKWIVASIVLIVILFMVWVTVLSKDKMTVRPQLPKFDPRNSLFGVVKMKK